MLFKHFSLQILAHSACFYRQHSLPLRSSGVKCIAITNALSLLVSPPRETFRDSESGGWLRSSAAAVDVDGSDSELIPVSRRDVVDLRRRQRRLHTQAAY